MSESPFINKEKIHENEFAFAIYDGFPVSKGHSLVIPKRIVSSVFDLDDDEYNHIFILLIYNLILKFSLAWFGAPGNRTPQ